MYYKITVYIPHKIKDAINTMKKAHPYEVPAYGVVKLENI